MESETHFLGTVEKCGEIVGAFSARSLSISNLFCPSLSRRAVHCGDVRLLRSLETEGAGEEARGTERELVSTLGAGLIAVICVFEYSTAADNILYTVYSSMYTVYCNFSLGFILIS